MIVPPMISRFDVLLIGAFLILKIYFLWALPITGDEIYWVWWGRHLEPGYYDHPPLVGWLLWLMSFVSESIAWYRTVALATCLIVSIALYHALLTVGRISKQAAFYLSLAFFVSPASLLVVMTANDTLLLLTSFLGLYALMRAVKTNSVMWSWIAGLFFGLAFLSKYFAVFLFAGVLVYAIRYRARIQWKVMFGVAVPIVIAIAQNLYYNYSTCWNNILFNFFSRTTSSSFGPENVAIYLVFLGILMTPWGLWWGLRRSSPISKALENHVSALPLYAGVPLFLALFFVSFFQSIGLHWLLMSVPIIWLMYACLPEPLPRKFFRFNAIVSVLIAATAAILVQHIETFLPANARNSASLFLRPKAICPLLDSTPVFVTSYSQMSLISWACNRDDVYLFASTSKFGRQDDHRTDFRGFAGKAAQILLTDEKKIDAVTPFFQRWRVEPFSLAAGTTHYRVIGVGFDYVRYRAEVLQIVSDRYYSPPAWFPQGQCRYKQQYGF